MEKEPNYIAIGTIAIVVLGLIYLLIVYAMPAEISAGTARRHVPQQQYDKLPELHNR